MGRASEVELLQKKNSAEAVYFCCVGAGVCAGAG